MGDAEILAGETDGVRAPAGREQLAGRRSVRPPITGLGARGKSAQERTTGIERAREGYSSPVVGFQRVLSDRG
ncbi:hypothetical protein KFK09_005045 [Dendrobium nobile]|uniref:Uncharacterized protein n=1 Tax=Dendrobium nobile TaxID=94219 RepID=A0A8T3BUL8_DENNO|nr:hypothetical protein KFK09_005045 [Dendrobium nobile]